MLTKTKRISSLLLTEAEEALAGAAQPSWAAGGASQKQWEHVLHPTKPLSLCRGCQWLCFQKNHMLAMSSDQMGKSMKLKELLMAPTGPRHLERCGDAQQKDEKQQVARG